MSQARKIYDLIQMDRDEMGKRWRDRNDEQHHLACERDKQCEELQVKIVEEFSADFPHLRKGAKG